MSDDYTPSTEEVLKYFSPPAHLTKAQRLGEGGGVLAHLVSLQNAHAKSVAEAAVRRWLVEHDRQVAADMRERAAARCERMYAGTDGSALEKAFIGGCQASAGAIRALPLTVSATELSTALQGVQEESKA